MKINRKSLLEEKIRAIDELQALYAEEEDEEEEEGDGGSFIANQDLYFPQPNQALMSKYKMSMEKLKHLTWPLHLGRKESEGIR